MKTKHLLTSIIILFIIISAKSQTDTLFWFAAPDISSAVGESPILLNLLTKDQPADVTIEMPANISFTPIIVTIPANSLNSVDLTPFISAIESPSGNTINTTGIKVSSSAPINASYECISVTNRVLFSLKGKKGLGTDFYTPFQKSFNTDLISPTTNASFEIVATEDSTTVLITPRSNITGHIKNETFTIILNEGETYSARDTDASGVNSLSGSIVSSNKNIAVSVFEGAMNINGCLNVAGDQITNSDFTGTDFIVQKSTSTSDKVYILAIKNNTTVTVTNSNITNFVLNWGETRIVDINDALNYIKASKAVYLIQVSGNDCQADLAQIPNFYCAGNNSTVFTRSSTDSLGVVLYIRSGFESMFSLNGNNTIITPSTFQPVPGTSGNIMAGIFYFNTTDVPLNSFNKITNNGDIFGMGIISGGNGNGSSYAFLSDFNAESFINSGMDDTICGNEPLALNGIVGGGMISGTWSTNGFGTFSNPSTNLINTYIPSPLDTIISPIDIILKSSGQCPILIDTIKINVTPAPIVNAGTNQILCANNANVNLQGSVAGGATNGIWSTLGTGSFSPSPTTLNAVYLPSAADINATEVSLVLTSTNGGNCANETDTVKINFTIAPTVTINQSSISVCRNNANINVSGVISGGASTGRWTTSGSGTFFPNNNSLSTSYQPSNNDILSNTMYLYLESTGNGNCLREIDSVEIIFTDAPTVNAGIDISACTNEIQINLSGSISGPTSTGIWSGGLGTYTNSSSDLNTGYIPSNSEIANGSISLLLTSTNNGNCNATSDVLVINFIAPPFANFNGINSCLGEVNSFKDFSLPGSGSINSWEWDFDNGQVSSIDSADIIYNNEGNYDVQLIVENSFGCKDSITKTINVFPLPVVDFSYVVTCFDTYFVIDFSDESSINQGQLTNWNYIFEGIGSQANQNPSQLFLNAGDYLVKEIVTSSNGCVDSITQTVTIEERPEAGFFYNTDNGLNIGATFEFIDTSTNAVNYSWNFGDDNFSVAQDPVNIYFNNGIYNVTQYVESSIGCIDSVSISLNINTVTNNISTLIPNAISPNGDGKNDVWKLEFINLLYNNATVEVFNKWGQQLYYSEGYTTPWDATYNGDKVSDGAYFYVIDLKDGVSEPLRGTILVLKNEE